MSILNCNCVHPAALADINSQRENLGALTRLFFQRKKSGATLNAMTVASADPTLQATWDALVAAVASTKVVTSPIIHEPNPTAGGAREYTTGVADGIPILLGENPFTIEGKFLAEGPEAIAAMKALECEVSDPEGLCIFLVNDCGNIIGQTEDDYTTFRGLDIQYFFLQSDPSGNNRENAAQYMFKIMARPGWLANRKIVTPSDFSALDYNF